MPEDLIPQTDTAPGIRKPYEAPQLETYGDLNVLTQALATANMNDKGSASGTRT